MHFRTLQHTATHCNTKHHFWSCSSISLCVAVCCSICVAVCCSMLQYVAVTSEVWCITPDFARADRCWWCQISRRVFPHTATSCNRLQQTATRCYTHQHNTLQHTWSCSSLLLPLVSNFLKNISISGLACSHVRHTSNATWMQHLCVYVYVYICMYIYIHISGLTQNKHLALDVFPCAPHMLPCAPHTLPCAPHIPRHLNFTTFVFVYICLYIYVYLFWLRHTCSHVRHTSDTTWFLQHLCTYIYVCIHVYVYICILILVNKFF